MGMPGYGGLGSPCPKCLTRGAKTHWLGRQEVIDMHAAPSRGFVPFIHFLGLEAQAAGVDVLERTCQGCGFSWYELPMDSPLLPDEALEYLETEEYTAAECAALRRLIVALWHELHLGDIELSPETARGVLAVMSGEVEDDDEEAISKAAPFFGPLRKENGPL